MSIVSKTTLKTYFETNDHPDQSNFEDLIDSLAAQGATGTPLFQDMGVNNNVYLITVPGVSAYASGQNYAVKIANVNTSAATLNVNNLGAVAITYNNGNPLTGSELPQNGASLFYYSGGNFKLPNINPATTGAITTLTGDVSAVGPGTASATLVNTAVSAGTYVNPTIAVDSKGRLTSAANGASPSAGALTLIAVSTASNSATIDFTSGINSTYEEYIFEFNDVKPSTDTVNLLFRTSSVSGVSFDSGASDYGYGLFTVEANGASQTLKSTGSTAIQVGVTTGNDTQESISGNLHLYNPAGTTNKKLVKYSCNGLDGLGGIVALFGGGVRVSAAVVNAGRFLFSSGNIASGIFRMYGVQKA